VTEDKKDEEVVVAIALPPHTGNTLAEFTYNGLLPRRKWIRENGPSKKWSEGEEDGTADN
jgi:hypothetical protein